jgi:hypothetical protein
MSDDEAEMESVCSLLYWSPLQTVQSVQDAEKHMAYSKIH